MVAHDFQYDPRKKNTQCLKKIYTTLQKMVAHDFHYDPHKKNTLKKI
jgi:hypothetical protein